MKRLSFILIICLIASSASAQITVGGGSGLEASRLLDSPDTSNTVVPTLWVQAAGSVYTFPTVELSAFLDAAGRAGWEREDPSIVRGTGSVEASVSYRFGNFSIRGTVDAFGEGVTGEETGFFQLGNLLSISYGTFDYAVFVEPQFVYFYDGEEAPELAGETGASLTVAETLVLTASADGYRQWTGSDAGERGWGANLEANWYPAAPISTRSDLRVGANRSDDVTSFRGQELSFSNYTRLDWSLSVSTSIGKSVNAELRIPVRITLKDHPAIVDDEITTEDEWRVLVSPGLANSVLLSSAMSLDIEISAGIERSNSTYGSLNENTFGASATIQYRFP